MRQALAALALALLIATGADAHAETAPEMSAAKRALVLELLELSGSDQLATPISQMILAQLEPLFAVIVDDVLDAETGLSAEDRERLRAQLGDFPAFAEEFTARFPDRVGLDAILREVYLPLYDAAFSEEELRAIVRFQRSPAGRKLHALAPALGERGIRDTLPRVEPRVMALVGEILADRRGASLHGPSGASLEAPRPKAAPKESP